MKLSLLLSATALALANHASAFYGQMAASDYSANEGGVYQIIYLTDYSTGSTYSGTLYGGFNSCTSTECSIRYVHGIVTLNVHGMKAEQLLKLP
jgi:hypothetical protein